MNPRAGWIAIGILLVGCVEERDELCKVGTQAGCRGGLVCESQAGVPSCVAEFVLEGNVADMAGEPISAATVVCLDAGGTALGLAVTDLGGHFATRLSWHRDEEGRPVDAPTVTLRVDAAGYQPFPLPPRVALPVDLALAVLNEAETRWSVENASTKVMLMPIAGDTQPLSTILGRVEAERPSGVLVVAVQGGLAASSAISGPDGSFSLFNVPAGETVVQGFRAGLRIEAEAVLVDLPLVEGVVLSSFGDGLTTVTGNVQMVNAGGAFETSVLLVPEALFEPLTARGECPFGLRAARVTGEFTIEGVPPGRWVALAAFENDGLVRDPDTSISGTEIVIFDTTQTGGNLTIVQGFKITGALAVVSPGAESLDVVATTPMTLVWQDDSSEKGYDLTVYDAFGNVVLQRNDLPPVSGNKEVEYIWEPQALQEGMIYQFRVRSWRGDSWSKTYISQTEDLKGAFLYQPKAPQ